MKKPTITEFNRAYVRLYELVIEHGDWDEFKSIYRVEMVDHGIRKNGDCAVRVLDSDGKPATLGSAIPNKITYSCFIEPPIVTWKAYYKEGEVTRCETASR